MGTAPDKVTDRKMYRAKDIERLLDCGPSKAYEVIREANKVLKAKGFYIVAGRVPATFLEDFLGLNYKG